MPTRVEIGGVDIAASLAAVDHRQHVQRYMGLEMFKLQQDLDRLERVIARTGPQVIVETGTHQGASALWFSRRPGVQLVITIDIDPSAGTALDGQPGIARLVGHSSVDPGVVDVVRQLVEARWRCMVVLDSLHTAAHVTAEIDAYGPMVTPGCMLVAEDGLYDWASREQLDRQSMRDIYHAGPYAAITRRLVGNPDWERVNDIEAMSPLSQCPAGWWRRHG
jgi:cephalosporin hydroxylase